MSAHAGLLSVTTPPAASEADEILRFRASERHLHWAIAIPFMVCYTTAAILVLVYNPDPGRPYRAAFSWLHRISGTSLALMPLLMLLGHWRDLGLHLSNIQRAWKWTLTDLKWLCLAGPGMVSSRIALPPQGKFNAGEKINFIVLMSTYPVYIATGLVIWFTAIPFMAWCVHVYLAMFVATPLMLGHVYLATVNPDTRVGLSGMISGFVDRQWARHHYHHWYEEMFGDCAPVAEAAAKVEIAAPGPVAVEPDNVVTGRPPAVRTPAAGAAGRGWMPGLPARVEAGE